MSALLPFPEPLIEKYRPKRVRDFIGVPNVRRALESFIKKPFASSWFFLGGSGLGKTTIVQAVAEEINAQLHEIPSAECDLDRVKWETSQCQYGAFDFVNGGTRYWHLIAVHEADRMTPSAQNAFLSKMDSTAMPPQTFYMFTANSRLNLEDRFMSRCMVHNFKAESMEGDLEKLLAKIYKAEGGKLPLNFCDIAKLVNYNVRDAINKVQSELLLGNKRKGLPVDELKIVEAHTHFCKAPKCHKVWKCSNPNCDLPYRSVCPECGGAKTVGTLRAKKAHATMRANAIAEHEAKKGKKKS